MKKKLPDLLKEHRLNKGLTQQEVADKVFANRTSYTKWETGDVEMPLSKLKMYIKSLGLSDSEVLEMMSDKERTVEQNDSKNSYEKIIGYFNTILKFAFDQSYSKFVIVAEGREIPFDKLDIEDKKAIETLNERELTEEDYKAYYAYYMREILEEDYYKAFVFVLEENPICKILFQFDLFGNEYYNEYWERYQRENELYHNFYFDKDETRFKENFGTVIGSIKYKTTFSFSFNSLAYFHNYYQKKHKTQPE